MKYLTAFLDIEKGLENLVSKPWAKEAKAISDAIASALAKDDEAKAVAIAQQVQTQHIAAQAAKKSEPFIIAAILLGAKNAGAKSSKQVTEHPHFDHVVDNAMKVFETVNGRVLEDHVTRVALKQIDDHQQSKKDHIVGQDDASATTVKKIDESFVTDLNAAVDSGGSMISSIGANMTTSRLVSFGFLAQAMATDISVYRLQAVLDTRTSKICRNLNGRTFRVERAYQYLSQILQITDPDELKAAAPWLKSNAATVRNLQELSTHELEERYGVLVPPFHPSCRTVLVLDSHVVVPPAGVDAALQSLQQAGVNEAVRDVAKAASVKPVAREIDDTVDDGVPAGTLEDDGPEPSVPDDVDTAVFQRNALTQLDRLAEGDGPGTVLVPLSVESPPATMPPLNYATAHNAEAVIDDLVALEPEIDATTVAQEVVSPTDTLPLVFQADGKLYIQSGLSAVVAAKLRGETRVLVRLVAS